MKDFVHLSDTFKYISHFRKKGHQIGRKIGDMLEVLTLGVISQDKELMSMVILEPKIEGFSGACHKVEFGIYRKDDQGRFLEGTDNLLGFIECKKVGVEQTVNSTFKNNFGTFIPFGKELKIPFNPAWAEKVVNSVKFSESGVEIATGGETYNYDHKDDSRYIFGLTNSGAHFFINDEGSLRDIEESIRACKVLEIHGKVDGGVKALLNDCLSGPQTPEKAKQASFVALDVRKLKTGKFDKRDCETECVSILVLTEFAHWEAKSLNMVSACIDYNLVVDDNVIVRAFEMFEEEYGDDFLNHITKEMFVNDEKMRGVVLKVLQEYDFNIFKDIADKRYKSISLRDGLVVVS